MKRTTRLVVSMSFVFLVSSLSLFAQEVQLLERAKPIERVLKPGDVHSYSVRVEIGEYLEATVDQRGIDVIVRVSGPDGVKILEIDSPNGTQGPEPIRLIAKVAGLYRIEVAALEKDAVPGKYEVSVNAILTAAQYAERLAREKAQSDAVVKWFTAKAVPLKTVEAGNGFADMQPLKRILKDARFVGLGEATHGTREFFQFKHRMVEFLVKEMGYRVFALEASYAGCNNINDYINGVSDDGAKALASQGFWTWNTEEVRSMIDWMRNYNAGVAPDGKIKFVGIDIQNNREARDYAIEYLKRVAPERAVELASLPPPAAVGAIGVDAELSLDSLVETPPNGSEAERAARSAKLKDVRAKYNELLGYVELNGPTFTQTTSMADYERAVHSLLVIAQYIDAYSWGVTLRAVSLRDLYMADNLKRFAAAEPAGTKFVIWAHNGHISTSEPSLGSHLRNYFGTEYYAVGFSFDHGGFQAREMDPKLSPTSALTAYTIVPAAEGTIDWHLSQTGFKIFFADLRTPIKDAGIARWLDNPHPMRSIGSSFTVGGDQKFVEPTILKRSFDGIFFINTTTRARPNPRLKNVAPVQ